MNSPKLRKEAKATTALGFTLEDGDAAGKLYTRSKGLSQAAIDRAAKQKEFLVREEKARQQEEQVMDHTKRSPPPRQVRRSEGGAW